MVLTPVPAGQEQHQEPDRTCLREVGGRGGLSEHTCPGCRAPLVLSCRSHCENKGGADPGGVTGLGEGSGVTFGLGGTEDQK